MKLILYHSSISKIGGCETFIYNYIKKLRNYYDIKVLYQDIAIEQLLRMSKYVEMEKYNPEKEYIADIVICSSAWGGFPETAHATTGQYIQILHADYEEMKKIGWIYTAWTKTTKHVAVSKHVADTFERMYGIKPDVIYNILDDIQPTKPILKLISATRLSQEKGYDKMVQFAHKLKEAEIKFSWIIFAEPERYYQKRILMEEVIYKKPTYDIFDYIHDAHYGVQFSKTEGCPVFVNECLRYETAMLVTNFKCAKEFIKDGDNGYILPFELFENGTAEEWKEALDKIVNQIPTGFNYKEKCTIDNWTSYLGGAEYKEKGEINIMKNITIHTLYYDLQPRTTIRNGKPIPESDIINLRGSERATIKVGDVLTVANERAIFLHKELKVANEPVDIEEVIEIETAVKQEPNKQTAIKKTVVKSTAKRKANAKK